MNYYHIWVNLAQSHDDLGFVKAVHAYMNHLKADGRIGGFRLTRRKLGFGPPEIGEFHIEIAFNDMAQMDYAFGAVAPRSGDVEKLHRDVYSRVTDFRSALYRDFPDPERT